MKPGVIIFRIQLLPRSETFIVSQAAAMRDFKPYFVGWRRVQGLDVPSDSSWVVDNGGVQGKLQELKFRYLGPSKRQVDVVSRQSPKLVYAHFALDGYAAMPLARRLGVPLVTALHGYDVTMNDAALSATRLGREYIQGRSKLQREGSLFLACSEYVRSRAIATGYPEDRTIVHRIGIDLEKFSHQESQPEDPRVLFVGRLVEKKGCKRLIEAMVEVQQSIDNVELMVIGDGPLRSACEDLAKEKLKKYRFLGAQSSDVVKSWMARSTLFCVPSEVASTGDAEGLGMVFLEAQAMGLPVVSTLSGGIPEAVDNGRTGLLVPEANAGELAKALLNVLTDRGLRERFKVAGMKRVQDEFDLAKQTNRLEGLFKSFLSTRGAVVIRKPEPDQTDEFELSA